LFRENDIDFARVNYFVEPLSEAKLRDLLRKANLAPKDVLRKKEPVYKELGISDETPPDEIIRLIVEHPSLLQRPIVEVGERAILARPAEKALDLIKPEK
jgi:arsenate reductase (glutaredoxin)